MGTENEAGELNDDVKYATSFRKVVLGVNSVVEVVVDLGTLDAVSTIAMKQILRSHPAFVITLNNFWRLSCRLKAIREEVIAVLAVMR